MSKKLRGVKSDEVFSLQQKQRPQKIFVIWDESACGYLNHSGEITFQLKEAKPFQTQQDAQQAILDQKLSNRYVVRVKNKPKEEKK